LVTLCHRLVRVEATSDLRRRAQRPPGRHPGEALRARWAHWTLTDGERGAPDSITASRLPGSRDVRRRIGRKLSGVLRLCAQLSRREREGVRSHANVRSLDAPRSCSSMGAVVTTVRKQVKTTGQGDAHDLTGHVAAAVAGSGLRAGIVSVFVAGSTAGVTTIEFEPGAVSDLNRTFELLAPRHEDYRHHLRWGDDNGSSHVRAALLGPSLTVPFDDGTLVLGTWQQIMLLEFDTRPRAREYVIQIIGE
jgi:secondary thiamine-phosphate synthase enzyme